MAFFSNIIDICCNLRLWILFFILLLWGCSSDSSPEASSPVPSAPAPAASETVVAVAAYRTSIELSYGDSRDGLLLLNLYDALRQELSRFLASETVEHYLSEAEENPIDYSQEILQMEETGDSRGDIYLANREALLTRLLIEEEEALVTVVLQGLDISPDGQIVVAEDNRLLEFQVDIEVKAGEENSAPFLPSEQSHRFPYILYNKANSLLGPQDAVVNPAGQILSADIDGDSLEYELLSVEPAQYSAAFSMDRASGQISIDEEQIALLEPDYLIKKNLLYSSVIDQYEFRLMVRATDSEGAFADVAVTLRSRDSDPVTCQVVPGEDNEDGYGSLEEAASFWGESEATVQARREQIEADRAAIELFVCRNLKYEIPSAVAFETTAADLEALPDKLYQPRESYRVIFKEEFNLPGSGRDAMDPRLWFWKGIAKPEVSPGVYEGENGPCPEDEIDEHLVVSDGMAKLKVDVSCFISALNTRGKFEYLYGYLEVRLYRLPDKTTPSRSFLWNTYNRSNSDGIRKYTPAGYGDYICRGQDQLLKRKRYFHMNALEKEYLEYRTSSSTGFAWLVFHGATYKNGPGCHPAVGNRGPGIHSGLWFDTFYFPQYEEGNGGWEAALRNEKWADLLASDGSFTLGIEWTPGGYKAFLNGRPLHETENEYRRYGYHTADNTGIYGYEIVPTPTSSDSALDGLIPETVSHVPDEIVFYQRFTDGQTFAAQFHEKPSYVYIDYVRVYQPQDKYAGMTRAY